MESTNDISIKYILLGLGGLYLLNRRSGAGGYDIPSGWYLKPEGYIYYNTDGFFNATENRVIGYSEKAMIWGVAMKLDPALILGCMFSESGGNEKAYRFEPKINDASYGLMQVLFSTALDITTWLKKEPFGEGKPGNYIPAGFVLDKSNIYNANLNIMLGTRYLLYQFTRYSSVFGKTKVQYMYAAYNAGTVRINTKGQYVNSVGDTSVNDYVNRCVNAAQKFRYALNNKFPAYLGMFPKSLWQYSGI